MRILVGLGGNLGDVKGSLAAAVAQIGARFTVCGVSSLWRSAAVGPAQPDYLNAAMVVEIGVHPLQLLAVCHLIEGAAGRDRSREPRWGPRRLDLDLLMAPGLVLEGPALTLPHPRLAQRRFALLPACELVPEWVHPRLHRTLADLSEALDPASQPCQPLEPRQQP